MGKEGTTALTALTHSSTGSTANPCSSHLKQVARELTDALLFWMDVTDSFICPSNAISSSYQYRTDATPNPVLHFAAMATSGSCNNLRTKAEQLMAAGTRGFTEEKTAEQPRQKCPA